MCDVNGWSFVKNSRKYHEDCALLLMEFFEAAVKPSNRVRSSNEVKLKSKIDQMCAVTCRHLVTFLSDGMGLFTPAASHGLRPAWWWYMQGTVFSTIAPLLKYSHASHHRK